MLQGFAGLCKCPISKGFSFLRFAPCCTVLRSRWCQSGVNITLYLRRAVVQLNFFVRIGRVSPLVINWRTSAPWSNTEIVTPRNTRERGQGSASGLPIALDHRCSTTGLRSLITRSWRHMHFLQVSRLVVPAKVCTSHGVRGEGISGEFGASPNASASKDPTAATTHRASTTDIQPSVGPLRSHLRSVGLRAVGQDYSACERGSPNLCGTSKTSTTSRTSSTPSTRTRPHLQGAALEASGHLQVSRRNPRGGDLRPLLRQDGLTQR